MAKREKPTPKSVPSFSPARGRISWIWSLLCVVVAVLLAVAFLSYDADQTERSDPRATNLVGMFGAYSGALAFKALGGAAWLLPVFLAWLGLLFVRGMRHSVTARFVAMFCCIISGSALAAMPSFAPIFNDDHRYLEGAGGWIGKMLYGRAGPTSFEGGYLFNFLGPVGTSVVLGTVYVISFLYILVRDISAEVGDVGEAFRAWNKQRRERNAEQGELKRLAKEAESRERSRRISPPAANAPAPEQKKYSVAKSAAVAAAAESAKAAAAEGANGTTNKSAGTTPEKAADKPARPTTVLGGRLNAPPPSREVVPEKKLSLHIVTPEETKKAKIELPQKRGDYIFPSLDLLDQPVPRSEDADEAEHTTTAEALLRTLNEFGVEVTLGEIHVGPVITRYEVFPAPGVRVEKIASLDKNIALGLRAQSVRILAPVPGKGCVGVEVPNKRPAPVGIREILESEDWSIAKAEIPLALGRDVGGKPVIADLTRMPHLLIAGATGSGKTVCINSIITSLLYFASPDDLRFIMVDPKIVEMKAFNDLPHMLIPVVTDPKKVPAALRWLIAEMELRYQIFSKVGVRNIAGFNGRKHLEKETPAAPTKEERGDMGDLGIEVPRDDEIEIPAKMPYIVCIIDELADLMMVSPADVETAIARLAQLARAAGIHLILATQRPSVNVITGVIKANLPCRIAFQVASKVDSRTILDAGGADQLIGRGDMLFSPPGTAKLVCAQGCFVGDEELNRVVEFLKRNGPPQFAEDVQRRIEEGDPDEDGEEEEIDEADDELMKQAIDVLRSTRRASTSMLQRRLRIGYNRAARIMELLETRGIVGPENGSSPREILVDLDTL